jgi:hypothetical protein
LALPACSHSDWHHSAVRAGLCDGLQAAEGYSLPGADWFGLVPKCCEGSPDGPSDGCLEDCWAARSPELSEEVYSRPGADWFALVLEWCWGSPDDLSDGCLEDCWAVRSPELSEEAYSRSEAEWFALVLECRWGSTDVPSGGLRDDSEAEQLCCRHSAPPVQAVRPEVEQSEAELAGSLRALGSRQPSGPARFSRVLPGGRLEVRSAALEHLKAVYRHCS